MAEQNILTEMTTVKKQKAIQKLFDRVLQNSQSNISFNIWTR